MRSLSFITLLGAIPTIQAQFVAAPTNFTETRGYLDLPVRYKEVPTGICETDPNVKSFSGYVDVEENQHIFFWFFEARNQDPKTAPLTVWINGGPGSSSIIGLFVENGPCGVDINGNVYSNPYSWNNATNMLYIDQPTQTGFSYTTPVPGYTDPETADVIVLPSNSCPDYAADLGCGTYSYPNVSLTANNTQAAAPNFYLTLQGFMGAFPQYSRESFHFATESYGGHYGPVFNEYIEEQNRNLPQGAKKITLESVMIGNGWYDPIIQYQAYYNFTVWPGNTYDYHPYNDSIASKLYNNLYGPGNCVDQLLDCKARGIDEICSVADSFCADQVESIYDDYLDRDEYDLRELEPDPFPYEFYVDYLNTPSVLAALGAYVNYTEVNNAVFDAFKSTGDDGRIMHTVEDLGKLLDQGVTVVMYTGDADYNCNWLGGQAISLLVNSPGFSSAGYANISTDDGVVHGQVRQSGQFAFVRVYESGHEVPFYQPLLALTMLERIINGLDVATGQVPARAGYKTVGPLESTYREGNGTIQWTVTNPDATYNTTTGAPNPVSQVTKRRRFKPPAGKASKRSV
ncbi:hypothetical protein UA08_09085 [Talaromyces atroroseus]|uniref:Carboxypeptidase S1-like protein B n=1 Tax=Talaromyces atroroseus TaxID=1441469 RepID=A0A1Q5Q708_TALAT|nr:hypothetical protein UA08_09085 [Talaromyces atroroseus]OKL55626.1 hypothetical protein UA08_09085 [Talaromyces atroroseus]